MILRLIPPLRYVWKGISAELTPRQIAWGVALGMLVGLIPKGNLTACIFGVLLLATRVNLGAGMLSALAFTAVSPSFDPLTHGIGLQLLSVESVRSALTRWYDTPLVPWLDLNNTVVLGSTTLGLLLLYPTKHLSELAIHTITSRLGKRLRPSTDQADASDPHIAEDTAEAIPIIPTPDFDPSPKRSGGNAMNDIDAGKTVSRLCEGRRETSALTPQAAASSRIRDR